MAVYFIRCGQHIKIGKSNSPWKRFDGLQTSNPGELEMLAIMPGDIEVEAELHSKFNNLLTRGEWFTATPELLRFIRRVRIEYPEEQKSPKKSPVTAIKKQIRQMFDGPSADDWRFEIKRKPRNAARKNQGSTAASDYYYWVVRVNEQTRQTVYYGTLDTLKNKR